MNNIATCVPDNDNDKYLASPTYQSGVITHEFAFSLILVLNVTIDDQ